MGSGRERQPVRDAGTQGVAQGEALAENATTKCKEAGEPPKGSLQRGASKGGASSSIGRVLEVQRILVCALAVLRPGTDLGDTS